MFACCYTKHNPKSKRRPNSHYEVKTHENLVIFFHGISTEFSVFFHLIFMAKVNGEKHMKNFEIAHEIPLNISHFMGHENFGTNLKSVKYPWIYHGILMGFDSDCINNEVLI